MDPKIRFLRGMAALFEQYAADLQDSSVATSEGPGDVMSELIKLPGLGKWQRQTLQVLLEAGEGGATTGEVAKRIGLDEANEWNTLHSLAARQVVVKLPATYPHRYRLADSYLPQKV